MDLSTIGVFAFLDGLSGRQTGELARKLERLGYSALWIPEGVGRDPFAQRLHARAWHLDPRRAHTP
jgi:alkanesulfonate monooxygenase SsuD/methylene tetrahydromethanopterin reductase-like flavin-dependent oxidoreductase (luciferase family)